MCLVIYTKGKNILKLYNITDIDKFFQVVDSCSGNVYITSPQGDKFNLKSSLTKYVAFANLLSEAAVAELELEVENAEDGQRFIKFMMG